MKQDTRNFIFIAIIFLSAAPIFAQSDKEKSDKRNNTLGLYVGLFEYNLNYERYLIHRPNANTNIRLGFGYWSDMTRGGNNLNAILVQMFGKRNSYLGLNLGAKYVFEQTEEKNIVLPEVYVGYRYEKANGMFLFRSGVSFPSLINIGFAVRL